MTLSQSAINLRSPQSRASVSSSTLDYRDITSSKDKDPLMNPSPGTRASYTASSMTRSLSVPSLKISGENSGPMHNPNDPYIVCNKMIKFLQTRGLAIENLFNPKGEQYDPIEIEKLRLIIAKGLKIFNFASHMVQKEKLYIFPLLLRMPVQLLIYSKISY